MSTPSDSPTALARMALAEFIGTYCLVFAGCGAIVFDSLTAGAVGNAGIGLTFGLIVMAMIYAVGDVSGAHLNPAVSLGFLAAQRLQFARFVCFVIAQFAGAIAAAATLKGLFPFAETLGQTNPADIGGRILAFESFVLEAILTAILMFVILRVATGSKEQGLMAGVAVGGVVALEAMFAGPICGASMNPARSLGPALLAGDLQHLGIYFGGPLLGSLLAVPLYFLLRRPMEHPSEVQ
ncbi:aquaporin [Stratiformator vulcanicus]|uniref:Aquaporin Z 2 n=1 Tax=Stratiformator vulcanicus TaxID=2527980 RepID=A0A517QZB7_9PLAN|nr:aquaporin [Stratiformator vulcanicus]QDT36982.1 Aquaporin Z 2 [Stratiformator vulcanicus]